MFSFVNFKTTPAYTFDVLTIHANCPNPESLHGQLFKPHTFKTPTTRTDYLIGKPTLKYRDRYVLECVWNKLTVTIVSAIHTITVHE
jgi:hypothetical protein